MTRLADALLRAESHGSEVVTAELPPALPAAMPPATTTPGEPLRRQRWFADHVLTEAAHVSSSAAAGRPLHLSPRLAQKIVTDPQSRPAAVEQYRRLAAALHHSQAQFGTKTIMIASAIESEGKSLSVCNLALTLSHSYRRRVLLIDADLRRPTLRDMFELPVTVGLSEGLRSATERELPLFEVSPNLMVLPSGRPDPDPIGGLASDRMARILAEATSLFDWVLIDTPPAGVVPDAKVLASMVDAAVLVIKAGRAPCALVRLTVDALGPEKIFGVVLNAAESATTRHAGGYGYYGVTRE